MDAIASGLVVLSISSLMTTLRSLLISSWRKRGLNTIWTSVLIASLILEVGHERWKHVMKGVVNALTNIPAELSLLFRFLRLLEYLEPLNRRCSMKWEMPFS